MREIGVGLLGLGHVGAGVVKLLEQNASSIGARLGARVVIRAIAVRDVNKSRPVKIARHVLTSDPENVVTRDDVDIVCELMGGLQTARTVILRAIDAHKHVVTANKAVLAIHGDEIFAAAGADVDVRYEAAVCGGVPVLRMLREGLASDRIDELHGIVNGTSNFIASSMADGHTSFTKALSEAQRLGYAEADPALDISGGDAAHKLAILIRLCFDTRVDVQDIFVEGIDRLDAVDFEYARRFGFVIKPLVIARRNADAIEARVHPAMVPTSWLLASVPGANNALYVRSFALGPSMYYGAGAGMMPTAMAVVSDLIEVGRRHLSRAAGASPPRLQHSTITRPIAPMEHLRSCYYLRFSVPDRPGVLGQLTTILGEHDISIARVIQDGVGGPQRPVRVVIVTHEACEGDIQRALKCIDKTQIVYPTTSLLRML